MAVGDDEKLSMLLDLMREPAKRILTVQERCTLSPEAVGQRELTIRLAPDPSQRYQILDVKHPRKGAVSPLELSGQAELLPHREHVRISQNLIIYRFMTLVRSIDTSTFSEAELARFDLDMARSRVRLVAIPTLSSDKAAAAFAENFARSGEDWQFLPFASLEILDGFSQEKLNGLARLCKRLIYRYLQLVRVALKSDDVTEITVRYPEQIERSVVGSLRPIQLVARFKRATREWINAPSPTLRLHIPWAKRTDHYTFSMDAPPHRFFALQKLLPQDAPHRQGHSPPDQSDLDALPFPWAINTRQGLASHLFVSGAGSFQKRLYVALRALEMPGRSMLRMMSISFLVMSVLTVLAIWRHLGVSGLPQAAALIPAVLAIGTFALQPSHYPGVLGYPARSRSTPTVLALVCITFIFWIASTKSLDPSSIPDVLNLRDIIQRAWSTWAKFGWIPVLLGGYWYCFRFAVVYRRTVHAYRDRVGEEHLSSSGQFYS